MNIFFSWLLALEDTMTERVHDDSYMSDDPAVRVREPEAAKTLFRLFVNAPSNRLFEGSKDLHHPLSRWNL